MKRRIGPSTLTRRASEIYHYGTDGPSQEGEKGMRCGTHVPNPQLPPQL
jgi:hypothetical protein